MIPDKDQYIFVVYKLLCFDIRNWCYTQAYNLVVILNSFVSMYTKDIR